MKLDFDRLQKREHLKLRLVIIVEGEAENAGVNRKPIRSSYSYMTIEEVAIFIMKGLRELE